MAFLLLGTGIGTPQQASAAAGCVGGVDSDFNGDGLRDVVIADPMATVSGKARAGLIHVVLGGGKGTVEVSQDTANVSDVAEAGDQFGFSFAVYDADKDGCSDLAVGVPYEDVYNVPDAGLVQVLYGSTVGIGQGKSDIGFRQGTDGLMKEAYEPEDWVGYSVATTVSATGIPYLIIGVPGEDVDGKVDSGLVTCVYGAGLSVVSVDEQSTGVWEDREAYDQFGASLAASGNLFVVGVPGESIDTDRAAGAVVAFRASINSDGIPSPEFGMGQSRTDGAESSAESGDRYGTSIAIAPYRPSGAASATDFLLAVGAPSEDLGGAVDAGAVLTYHVTATGAVTLLNWIDQDTAGVEGAAEAGDFFGQRLTAVNTTPSAVGSASTMRLAVGVPGEESAGGRRDVGGVQVFPMLGAPGTGDVWLEPGAGIPATAGEQLLTGISLGGTRTSFFVGMPYGPAGGHAVYGFPWGTSSGEGPTQTWKPGEGGIPAGDGAFGTAVG
ncbi:FG-GAP repeat domain-containing protein [Streptomyces sp. NPDC059169]|uniref:FG-GAP repeat domain-containing protein n=1 Tax=unclassified Streptomyces TaxID=2593676 RepID=UPI0036CD13E8